MRVRAAFAAVVITLLLMPAAATARSVGHVRVAIDTVASFPDYARSAQRHGYVILQSWQADRMRALKRANPNVKVLMYKNLAFASEGTSYTGRSASGVYYAQAHRDHPEWFLHNTDGRRFTSWSYDWLWAMDVGNSAYQRQWADNVLYELQAEGWDGVFMDDVNPTFKYHYTPSRIAKYPNDAAYTAATRSALAAITPRIRGAGKRAVANIGSWSEYYSTGIAWLDYLDGAMDEMFLKFGNTPGQGYDPGRWGTQINEIRETQRRGKDFLGITHSAPDDAQAALFGYATMLLAGEGGRAHFALAHDYAHETWFPEYDYDLGSPVGPPERDDSGVWRRRFERGLVVVNPTREAKRVSLGRTYRGSAIARAGEGSLGPTSGLVLKGDGADGGGRGPAATAPSVLAIVKGRRRVELRWTRGRRASRVYRIVRNGKVMRRTRRRTFVDRRARPGRRYRYRVIAFDRRGRRVGKSRRARVRAPRAMRRARSSATAVRLVRGSLAAARPGGWRRAYVARRVRIDGKLRWRRVTRVVRPRSRMRLAIRVPRRAAVRLVVRSVKGTMLRSTPFRAGRAY